MGPDRNGDQTMSIENNKFQAGTTYYARCIADVDCICTAKVVRRTAKSVWIEDEFSGKVARRAISVGPYGEPCKDGSWGFCASNVLPEGGRRELIYGAPAA